MTDTTEVADTINVKPRTPLGVGSLIGDTFSVFFRKLPAILVLAFVPALLQNVLETALVGQAASQIDPGRALTMFLVVYLAGLVIWSVVTASIVQLSYDAKLDRPARLGLYIAAAIKNLPAVIVLAVVAAVLYFFAAMFFIVPFLWLFAVFSVFVPAIVIEGQGFRALGRSAELTKNYRWPIVGALILMFLCVILLSIVVGAATMLVASAIPSGAFYVAVIFAALGGALGYGVGGVMAALIFARLKEIKEGVSVSDLVEVFK